MNNETNNINITIIGAGSWGTTLAVILAAKGYNINLWTRSGTTYNQIKNSKKNEKYTGGLGIPGNVTAFMDLEEGIGDYTDIVIFAVPSHALREIITRFSGILEKSSKTIKKAWDSSLKHQIPKEKLPDVKLVVKELKEILNNNL